MNPARSFCFFLLLWVDNQLHAAQYWYDLGGGLLTQTAQQACEILDARIYGGGTLGDVLTYDPQLFNNQGAACYLGDNQLAYSVSVKWETYTLFDQLNNQNSECTVGNPIDPVSGSKLHKEEIISINGVNDLSFIYFYDSMINGGWTHNFNKAAVYSYEGSSIKYNFNNTSILDTDVVTEGQTLFDITSKGERPKGILPTTTGGSSTPESACNNWVNFKSNYSFSWLPSSTTNYIGNGKCEVIAGGQVKFVIDVYGYTQGRTLREHISTDPLLPANIAFKRGDGSILEFVYDDDTSGYLNTSNTGESIEITDDGQAITGFLLVTSDDAVEHYTVDTSLQWAKLASIEYKNGNSFDLTYDGSYLTKVTSTTGEYLDLTYESYGEEGLSQRLKTINDRQGRLWQFDYNVDNNLEFIHYPDGESRKFYYGDQANNMNLLTGIQDENGNSYAHWDYDSGHRAILSAHGEQGKINRTTITYPDGSTANVSVIRESAITGESTSLANTYRTNVISSSPMVSEIMRTGCADCVTEKSFTGHDLQTGNIEFSENMGLRTEYGNYDNRGNPGIITEASGTTEQRTRSYTYDPRYHSKLATISEASVYPGNQKITSYQYDDFGDNTTASISGYDTDGNPISRTTTYEYAGPYHQLTRIDGPRSDVDDSYTLSYYADTETEGNNRARLRSMTDPGGNFVYGNINYTQTGNLLSYLDANNVLTTFNYYYGNDRLQSQERLDLDTGEKRLTEWTYLATGEVKTVTTGYDAGDRTILTFNYDSGRRLTGIVDGLGNTIEYVLDTEGNIEQENTRDDTGVLKKQLNQTFDVYNRLQLRTQVNEQYTEVWSPEGTLDKVMDGNNIVTDYSYDNLRRLTQINQDAGGSSSQTADAITRFNYDIHDNLTGVTNPVNGETIYTYDDLGNRLTRNSDDTGLTSYTHDEAGNITTVTDANGETITYSYDALNRLTAIVTSNPEDNYHYEYDYCKNGYGRLCKISNNGYAQYYQYNAFGNITSHQALQYSYDSAGRLQSISYPSGAVVQYSYDLAGQVLEVAIIRDGSITPIAVGISYEPFGEVSNLIYGNGLSLNQSRDSAYRPISQIIQDIFELDYVAYDVNGNLQQRDDGITGTSTHYTYDTHDRLTTASGHFGSRNYSYDKNANRISLTENGNVMTNTYDPQSNRLSMRGLDNVTLDNNGNTLNIGSRSYSYTKHNRLFQVFENSELRATYRYNGSGQRISKTLTDGSGKYFLYGAGGRVMAETDIDGNILLEYIYLNGQLLAIYTPDTDADGISNVEENRLGTNPANPDRDNDGIKDLDEMFVYGTFVNNADTDGDGINDSYELILNSNPLDASINYGDINFDGEFNLGDYVLVMQFILGSRMPTPTEQQQADINQDGVLNIKDMLLMQRVLLGIQVSWLDSALESLNSLFTRAYNGIIPPAYATNGNGELYYVLNDHLGTPHKITNELGFIVWQASYDPFGKATVDNDVDGDGRPVTINIRFPGQYYDSESELHYNYHRYYDPELGRYLTSDPIGLTSGTNTYNYVFNNPSKYTDQTGECPWCVGAVIGGVIGGVGNAATTYFNGGNASDVVNAFGVGTVVGAIFGATGGVGGTITSYMGTGAVSGAITAAGTTLVNGGNLSQVGNAAINGATAGALTGAFGHSTAVANALANVRKGLSSASSIARGDLTGALAAALSGLGIDGFKNTTKNTTSCN